MKRVVLLGDSIRQGYEPAVRAQLADVAYVWSPADNGQHSVNLLLNFWSWVVTQQPDVLHLNAGLWDMRRAVRNHPGNVIPLESYRANVDHLLSLAKQHTSACIIWATTTPIHHDHANITHFRKGLAGRDGADVALYNAAAIEVARRHNVRINDLHQVVTEASPDRLLDADGVHFTAPGFEILGHAVARCIRDVLAAH